MPWLALEFEVAAAHTEVMTDVLLELGALSVSTEDAEAGTAQESALYADPTLAAAAWRRNRITALVPLQTDAAGLIAAAAHAAGLPVAPEARAARVEDEDWVRRNQEQFGPLRAGARLWVVPSWCELPRDDQAVVIRLDPGLAFGTGSHPSTRLALAWLEQSLRGGERVLDYGCGSGILAIAAMKLGAAHAAGVDIDPAAVHASNENAGRNRVACEFSDSRSPVAFEADIVVANILASPLKLLAPLLADYVRAGGRIALSGILEHQQEEVKDCYAQWFEFELPAREEGWVCLSGMRRALSR